MQRRFGRFKPKPKGRPASMNFKRKQRKTDKPLTRKSFKGTEYLRAENEILKVQCLNSPTSQSKKAQTIMELRHKYDLEVLPQLYENGQK
jgi:hypothetical protein